MATDYSEEAKKVLFGTEEETAQEKIIFEDEDGNLVINQYILTQVMNGSTNDEPNAISAIMVNNYEQPANPLLIEECVCNNAEIQLYCMGGCLIAELYFTDEELFKEAEAICKEYLAELCNPDLKDDVLVLSMTPSRVNYITMLACSLIYADGYRTDGEVYKLVLGFDNNKTQTVIAQNLDLRAISESIEHQIDMEQKSVEQKIAMLEEEAKKTEVDDLIKEVLLGEDEQAGKEEEENEN